MPKDAKLGLAVGVGLVVLIAVVFFKRDPASAQISPNPLAPAAVNSTQPPPESRKSAVAPVEKSASARKNESAEPPAQAASPVAAPLVPS